MIAAWAIAADAEYLTAMNEADRSGAASLAARGRPSPNCACASKTEGSNRPSFSADGEVSRCGSYRWGAARLGSMKVSITFLPDSTSRNRGIAACHRSRHFDAPPGSGAPSHIAYCCDGGGSSVKSTDWSAPYILLVAMVTPRKMRRASNPRGATQPRSPPWGAIGSRVPLQLLAVEAVSEDDIVRRRLHLECTDVRGDTRYASEIGAALVEVEIRRIVARINSGTAG